MTIIFFPFVLNINWFLTKKANHSYRIPTVHEIQQKLEDLMLMLEV